MSGITLWQNQQILAVDYNIVAGETVVLLSSSPQSNANSPENSIRVSIDYENLTPAFGTGRLGAVLEVEDANDNWLPVHYQFSPLANGGPNGQATKRILVMQPNLDTYNLGIDDIVYPVDRETARISRGQGILPPTKWRVCILLTDADPVGGNAFQSVTISATAETYNV